MPRELLYLHSMWTLRGAAGRRIAILAGFGVWLSLPASAQDLPSGPVTFGNGRVAVGTDISFSTSTEHDTDSDPVHAGWFNYTDYEHDTMRLMRVGVTADVQLTDRIA